MRIARLIAAGLLLAAPALAAERPHNAKYSRAADPRPGFSAPVRYAARAVHTKRLARPVAGRLVGGYGYGGIQLIGRVRGPRPLIPTGYEVPGGTFYINNSGYVGGITFDNGRAAALPKIFWDRLERESGGTAQ